MYNLEYFYYIVEIEKSGSISRAAQKLYLSQPYLSVCLKNTEDIFGAKIFERTNKGVTPTKVGLEFIDYSKEIIHSINQINQIDKDEHNQDTTFSVVSMPSYTILDLFHNFKAVCSDKYPDSNISYKETPNTYIADKIYKGTADIGIIYTTSTTEEEEIEQFKKMNLTFTPLICDPLAAIVSKHNKLYDRNEISLNDLKDFDFLVENIKLSDDQPPIPNNPFPETFKTNDKHTLKFNNNRSLLYYLSKNDDSFCIGQKSLNLTNPLANSGYLKYLPITDLDVHFTIGYLVNENTKSSELEESFINFVEQYFGIQGL